MTRTVLRFGLWSFNVPMPNEDKRLFYEDKRGNWPLSQFQRRLGIQLHTPGIYGRSFARMGNWKGFYLGHSRGSKPRDVVSLILDAKDGLGASRFSPTRIIPNERKPRIGSGYAALYAPKLRLLKNPPFATLVAIIYVKRKVTEA